ncbi:NADH-quinone oxidoreductase subunit I [Dissulfurispira thermophila]|uniref:NADH-quinone oxidoreductase subunit I n=2 Tax=root TaxID=1 RepID=A0A7G1H4E7_9BACT|nr:NADH-quinone oxidoreductase subunit NuoI [Dissulfurispira thermophila]BCB97022.1 NADH-quinone oxidoreductase subunit I [Dissulfurispira thermophila]
MTIKDIAKKVFLIEIFKGMALTLRMMFTHAVTRQYPEERREPFPGFRGLHALVRNPDGKARCVGCGLCAAICPSQCINIYTSESKDHKKVVDRYEIEVLRCVYCAFCVEACPFGAVVLTPHFEYSDYSRDALYMDKEKLLSNWDKFMTGKRAEEYFERFWRPKLEDFTTPENQPVFRGKEG